MGVSIRPLCFGWIEIERSLVTYGRGFGQAIRLPLLGYLIDDPAGLVIVDTGPPAPEWCREHLRPITQTSEETLTRALARVGAGLADVDVVVLTHLHWDHCGGTDLLPRATVVAQRTELEYAHRPSPLHLMSYQAPATGLPPLFEHHRVRQVDGDHRLTPSIELLHTPGHSPGSQVALVTCERAGYLIAGDAIPLLDNLQPLSRHARLTPNGIHVDLRETFESMERLVALGLTILPGHEPTVLDRPEYR
jgi:N-acyl homoserine lactone hydrolase